MEPQTHSCSRAPIVLFIRVRGRGILRSSVSGGGTLQREEGDVILLLPALLYEGVELFQEIVPWRHLIAVLGDQHPKPGEAEHLTFWVVCLYQPVAVEQGALTLLERSFPPRSSSAA